MSIPTDILNKMMLVVIPTKQSETVAVCTILHT